MSQVRSDATNDPQLPPSVGGREIQPMAASPVSPPLPTVPEQPPATPVPPPLPDEFARPIVRGSDPVSPFEQNEVTATGLPPVRTDAERADAERADPLVLPPRWKDPPPSPSGKVEQVKIVDREPQDDGDRLISTVKAAPPWLVSCLVHALIVIVLGLIPLLSMPQETLEFVASMTDEVGEQTELESFTDADLQDAEAFLPPTVDDFFVEDPQPMLAPNPILPELDLGITDVGEPQIGELLSGRQEGRKEALLAAYGGSEKTESAVLAGLRWLQRRQDNNSGQWTLSGRGFRGGKKNRANFSDGSIDENKAAATAMAMLAFQGYGQTHMGGPRMEFRRVVARAKTALLKMQGKRGDFANARRRDISTNELHTYYTQALCAFALCELYAMSGDSQLRDPAQKAVDFLVKSQDTAGGWRYGARSGFTPRSDLSVTGWVMMALQSARMADLKVPNETFYRIDEFLESVSLQKGSMYAYHAGRDSSLTMSAVGLLCRQYLGWKQDHPPMLEGADALLENAMDDSFQDAYYWYYATQTLHNLEGEYWKEWNAVMSEYLPNKQVSKEPEHGSWSPNNDRYGDAGGRLYTTCLSIYMLEVYYRHLPIYTLKFDFAVKKPNEKQDDGKQLDEDVETPQFN